MSFSTPQFSAVGFEAELTLVGKACVHSFNKFSLCTYYVPGTTEEAGETSVKKNRFCLHGT